MLTVLMATYNGAATLPGVLAAYGRLVAPAEGWRLIIADNGSNDGTAAVLERHAGGLPLLCVHEPRRGKNVALNAALALALAGKEDNGLFVFTDDDATPDADWLQHLAAAAREHPDHDLFGGTIVADWAVPPPAWLERLVPLGLTFGITPPATPEGPVFPGLVWGANMAIRRGLFEAGLRFDESIGPTAGAYAMGSETQLTRRLGDAGHRAWFCPGARVAHHIRAHQMTQPWVLERAWRFGRGKYRQDCPGRFPALFGLPRWMLRQFAGEAIGLAAAWLRRDADGCFRHRWELAFLRGYFHEAKRQRAGARKRVLITSYSGELGGMELRMADEARFLTAGGYDAVLALRPFPGSPAWIRGLQERRLAVSRFAPPPVFEQWRWRRVNRLRAALFDSRTLRRLRPDLVHVAFCWSVYGATALWLAARCRLPAVISVHNTFPPDQFSPWHRPMLHEAFAAVRGVYGATAAALGHFVALYRPYLRPDVRLAVIPNCVDTGRFRPAPALRAAVRQRWQLPSDALLIGSVARLSEQKRPEALIRLLHALRPRFPALFLLLAGSGPLEPALRRLAIELDIEPYVIFAGFQQHVDEIMPALDLHLLLSRREGFGIATIEALACGVPAVATDVPGNADVLDGLSGGVLVPLDDEAAVVATVAGLLADPARRARMGEVGRAEVAQRYGMAHVQRLVHQFYEGLL
ncbi:glycosyltransferase involved in cell wall biosynthesis [Pseudoduganella lurida]|uniref:Glycosyltransferase involved in cell wall biosynthesis n=1 Tax=Pseudoduganella lurida TaxID=1036180 RepID=A0A562RJ87_9BURK|nr:glycosyltransferase [Pseudoduganella lurida]TWI69003.1 glycosyltransferase involved in cell wall biosynthesis [Pseudoduganella lurida]